MLRRLAVVGSVVAMVTVLAATSAEAAAPAPTWRIQATGSPAGSKPGAALNGVSCPTATFCAAVGTYTNSGGSQVTLAEDWTSTGGWKVQPSPNPKGALFGTLWGVSCTSATQCEAVGQYLNGSNGFFNTLAESWNGHIWQLQVSPNPTGIQVNDLLAVSCASSTFCEAVGDYSQAGSGTSTLAEGWNGTKWVLETTKNSKVLNNLLQGVACPTTTVCYAVGYDYSTTAGASLVERWQSSTWTTQTTKDPAGSKLNGLFAVSCSSATSCEAVGLYKTSHTLNLADSWNGTSWSAQIPPSPVGAKQSNLDGVSCPPTTTFCTAVGTFNNSAGLWVSLAEQWNGTKWVSQGPPNPSKAKDTGLLGVACLAQTAPVCEAVGGASNIPAPSTVPATLAERYQ